MHNHKRSIRRQAGQGMSEYIIITALIAVAGIGVFAAFGDVLQRQSSAMANEMAGKSGTQDIQQAGQDAGTARQRAQQADDLQNYDQQN
jgi:Flp pilus assembly pilin Flp